MSEDQIVYLDPADILVADNTRFGLKTSRIQSLSQSILDAGGVLSPVEVAPIDAPAKGGPRYSLTAGFYRHAAVSLLNKEQNAGLKLPAIARTPADAVERLKHQLAENIERENQSPMDQAVSIKKLLDAGVSRAEVRRIFSRPGGRKGSTVAPASNAWVNIMLNLLELPKGIQTKIHDGQIGVAAAYELGKVPADKRAAVIERAEAERQRQIEAEEKDEEKFLQAEAKVSEAVKEQQTTEQAIETARKADAAAAELVTERSKDLEAIRKEPFLDKDEAGRAEHKERLKAAEALLKGAQKTRRDASGELADLLKRSNKLEETVKAQKAKLESARKAKGKPAAKKALGQAAIKKAAEAEGTPTGVVALNASEIRQVIKDVSKGEGPVAAIGEAFGQCFSGVTTTKQLISELAAIVQGAVKPVAATAKK